LSYARALNFNVFGGGGGIRTHVLHESSPSFYEYSLLFNFIA